MHYPSVNTGPTPRCKKYTLGKVKYEGIEDCVNLVLKKKQPKP